MASNFPATLALILALAGCGRESPRVPLDHGWAPPGACVFVGNRADRHYCATTGTQILANPAIYDGQLVQVSGWVVASPDQKAAILYLTRDARDASESHGSVNLSGHAVPALAEFAHKTISAFEPVQARVCGRFRLYGLAPDGSRVKQGANSTFRFGAIEELECGVP